MNPGVPLGTMIVEISFLPSAMFPVTAVTVTSEVMSVPELVMNCLLPLMIHSPSSSRAVVRVPPASEPAPGLGEPETGQRAAGHQFRQPLLLLLLGAEPVDRHRAETHPGLQRDRHRLVDLAEFLERQGQREVVAAHAAVLLRERQPEQSHLAHLGDDLVREAVLLIVFGRHRRDDGAREVGDRIAEILVFLG